MRIPLHNFSEVIDETILERGESYYRYDHVTDFVEISNGEFEASVSGSEEYTVRLVVEDDEIKYHSCDCPYDFGPVCKHTVASIYYLVEDELGLKEPGLSEPVKEEKKKPVSQQIEELLDKVSHEDLKKFIREQSKEDKQFRRLILASFTHLIESPSKEFYQKQIRSVVNSATGSHGFIDWHEISNIEQGIAPIVRIAKQHVENEDYEIAIYINTAIVEELTKVEEYCDDSDGNVSCIIDNAFDDLLFISAETLPENIRKDLFDYCVTTFENKSYDWEWHSGYINMASNLALDENEADIIIRYLDSVDCDYERETTQVIKLDIISQYKSKEEVQQFVDENITIPSIRNREVKRAIKSEEFDKAITLCNDGIRHDEQDKPGIVNEWYDWLLKIALIQKNTVKIIEYARYRLIESSYSFTDHYEMLKQHVSPNDWKSFLEEIIAEINPRESWRHDDLIRNIYISEKWWDRLFLLLKQNPSLDDIADNEKYLAKDYSQELVELYSKELVEYVDRYTGRNHYISACSYLRRMKKLGGHEEVKFLIEQFKAHYPRRKALMEELSLV